MKPSSDCYPDPTLLSTVRELLAEDNLTLPDDAVDRLATHVALIKQFNHVVGVVSKGDVNHLWERHVVDSLSLAPVIARLGLQNGRLLDIGSGGGFPAVPIGVLLPNLRITMLERSERKVGFLRKVVRGLEMANVTVVCGTFTGNAIENTMDVVTARAVDRPEKFLRNLGGMLRTKTAFLHQGPSAVPHSGRGSVHPVEDRWKLLGLRRGTLAWLEINERS